MGAKIIMNHRDEKLINRFTLWIALCVAIILLYVLSSGPVIGLAFRLREATGWNGLYSVLWLYYPLLVFGHGNPFDDYIDWWVVNVFQTVGPG